MNSNQNNKLNNVEADDLASFEHRKLNILTVLKENHQSSSAFWEVRDLSNPNEVIGDPYVAIDFDDTYFLGLGEDGKLTSLNNHYGNKPIYPDTTFTSIAVGYWHSIGLGDDGKLIAWRNDGRRGQTYVPGRTYTAVAAGLWHNIALRDDGEPVVWEVNDCRQRAVPNGIYTTVAAGHRHSMALRDDGRLIAWGRNNEGQTYVPDGIYTAIAAGADCSLALRDDDELIIFGDHKSDIKGRYLSQNRPFVASGSHQTFVIKPDGEFLIIGNRRLSPDLSQSLDRPIIFSDEAIVPY